MWGNITLNDGVVLPGIAYGVGTAWFAIEKDGAVSRPLVDACKLALAAGYTHLDNAEAYANETSVGVAIKESGIPREQLFITTKIATGANDMRNNVVNQLRKLQIDQADLFLLHWPYDFDKPGMPTLEEAWLELEKIKRAGLTRSIGVSNYTIEDLKRTLAVATEKISVNQIELHPYVYEKSKPLLAFMKEHGITIEAYGPSQPVTKFSGGPLDETLIRIASALTTRSGSSTEPTQVLLKWVRQLGAVVVTTSGKDWRMKQQLTVVPDLTEEEMEDIEREGAKQHCRGFMKHMDV